MADVVEDKKQFGKTAKGYARRWEAEIQASEKLFEDYMEQASKVVDRSIDERTDEDGEFVDSRVNLFWSNTKNMESALFANLPSVDVKRMYDDNGDDVARVATRVMERALNYDVMTNGEEYTETLKNCLKDRLVAGLGAARVFYEVDDEDEAVVADWYHWSDVRWGWARVWAEIPWIAFRNYLSKEDVEKRFGKKYVKQLSFTQRSQNTQPGDAADGDTKDLWHTAEVWEIWDKESNCVYWWAKGCQTILDKQDDPLELEGFFPCPKFMIANNTTSLLMPKPDFILVQDLLNEVDVLQTRISILTEAVKVVGVYDSSSEGIQRMLNEGVDNELIPVENWAMFAEKGGIQGQVDWFPLDQVVEAIQVLQELQSAAVAKLERMTGQTDIISGSGTHPREGVGTQEMKAEFGSVRLQAMEEELAQFATDIAELKAEIMCKHFEPENIISLANAAYFGDADTMLLPDAIELLQTWNDAALRIKIRSESMAQVDYSKLRHERTEYINNMALFMQSAAPLVEQEPSATPFLLEMLKWGMAGFKGSDTIEGVLDQAIEAAKKAPPKQDDDGESAKMQAQMQLQQMKIQGEIQKVQLKLKGDMALLQMKFQTEMEKIAAKGDADFQKEEAQALFATMQREAEAMIEMTLNEAQSSFKIEEIKESAKVRPSSESGG